MVWVRGNICMAIDWIFQHRPSTIDEMALYPALKKKLKFYEKSNDFSHLIFHGGVRTGKTSAARILGAHEDRTLMEIDCAQDNSKQMLQTLAKGTTSINLFGRDRLMLLDEFHEIPEASQRVLNKAMEDRSAHNTFIFCVNVIEKVADSIFSRCFQLGFDVGVLNPKKKYKLELFPFVNCTVGEWKDELKRAANIVADKAGVVIPNTTFETVLENDFNLTDARKFIRAVEEQLKEDEADN